MKMHQRKSFWTTILGSALLILCFQNCAPAQLSVSGAAFDSQNGSSQTNDPAVTPTPTPTPGSTPTSKVVRIRTPINGTSYFSLSANANGTGLEIWDRVVDAAGQNFEMTAANEFRSLGKCIDSINSVNGGVIQLQPCDGRPSQKWYYNSTTETLRNFGGLCVDLPGGNTTSGTRLNVFSCNGGPNQQWTLVP